VSYEDDVKRLLTRRWNITVGAARKSAGGGSGTPSPAPYLQHQRSAGLGATVLVEEEEEDEDAMGMGGGVGVYRSMNGTPGSSSASDMYAHGTPPPLSASSSTTTRARSFTASSVLTSSTLGQTPSTAYTTPDLGLSSGMSGIGNMGQPLGMNSGYGLGVGAGAGLGIGLNMPLNGSSSNLASLPGTSTPGASVSTTDPNAPAPTGVTPLTPVSALPTGDAEAQLGWVKVADPDLDAFMVYGAIVPEYVRLEGLLVKSIV
jgi:xylulokinase